MLSVVVLAGCARPPGALGTATTRWRIFPSPRLRGRSPRRCPRLSPHSGAAKARLRLSITHIFGHCRRPIPKGLYRSAQGCEARATLGRPCKISLNPNGVASALPTGRYNPVGVDLYSDFLSRVVGNAQPQAGRGKYPPTAGGSAELRPAPYTNHRAQEQEAKGSPSPPREEREGERGPVTILRAAVRGELPAGCRTRQPAVSAQDDDLLSLALSSRGGEGSRAWVKASRNACKEQAAPARRRPLNSCLADASAVQWGPSVRPA